MKLIMKNKQFDALDDALFKTAVRIQIQAICNLEKINTQYFIRQKSFKKLYYYCREIGLKNTILKIISRSREKIRNEKYVSIGIGRIIQSASALFLKEEIVFFIAYNHPACPERVVIDQKFVFPVGLTLFQWISEEKIVWLQKFNEDKWWAPFTAWSPFSGQKIEETEIDMLSENVKKIWRTVLPESENYISLKKITHVRDIILAKRKIVLMKNKNAVLFGYGNYAKTMIIPNLHKKIVVTTIHEIDATQLLPHKKNINYDTSPLPRDKQYDVYLIAGYHHTHVDIAIKGLKSGADVVVEKPLMTTRSDLFKLTDAMQQSKSCLYACFQRRYHRFNDYAYLDFKCKLGDPISYYAIIYEEILPNLHWYRWPNSRSAIISNGCHWIDHFLFLNNFSAVLSSSAQKTQNSETIILVELMNGATLSLTLSHVGSARIGMQEYVELRSRQNTAKIINGNRYQSENSSRIVRRSKTSKYESYKKMYQLISQNIVDKKTMPIHDSWEKVEMVSSLVLSLDEQVLQN